MTPRRLATGCRAFISGCAGLKLTSDERALFAGERPFGLILFGRNCGDPDQMSDLCADFRRAVAWDAPIFIDQEGGRVQRMRAPHWAAYAHGRAMGDLATESTAAGLRAAWLHGRLIAADLDRVGIDVNCAPVLDVLVPGADEAIGDRSFGGDPDMVANLGRQLAEGLLDGGVLPVAKHMPGQGRATADSHLALPIVEAGIDQMAATDFRPFAAIDNILIAMTAHVAYAAVDRINPATVSRAVVQDIIRKRIGFEGLLLSDDVSMHALSGDYGQRAAAIYDAGCDLVLHCNGRAEEMRAIAEGAPVLSGISEERAAIALAAKRPASPFDREADRSEYLDLMARSGWVPPDSDQEGLRT